MLELRTDLVNVFTKDQEVTLERGTCFHKGFCDTDPEGNPINGVFVKVLVIDNQPCKRPKLASSKQEGISEILKGGAGYWGQGTCANKEDACSGTLPDYCTNEQGQKPYDWGDIVLDKGQNNFYTTNPTPTDRDVTALVRCSIVPPHDKIEEWLNDPENFAEFEKVKHILYELILYYAYEKDDETQERDRMMRMRWQHHKDKIRSYMNKYKVVEYLWD